jgi:hypothetical protein
VQDDPVVGGDRVGLQIEALTDARAEGKRPGRVDAAAVGREDAQPPVADLVAKALHHDRLLTRQHARRRLLLAEVVEQVARGARIEVVVALQRLRLLLDGPARERADRFTQLLRAADRVALPERHRPRRSRRRSDDHAIAADFLDPPGRGAQQEGLPRTSLVDHLLVELPHAAAVGESHGVEATVRDRAGVGDRELARALARADRTGDAVPDDARAQLAELL